MITPSTPASDVELEVKRRYETDGDSGLLAHVHARMVSAYMTGKDASRGTFQDHDSLALTLLYAVAKSAVAPGAPSRECVLEAATVATQRLSFFPPSPAVTRNGEFLLTELINKVDGDFSRLEGIEYPDHWTLGDVKTYVQWLREMETIRGPVSQWNVARGKDFVNSPPPPVNDVPEWGFDTGNDESRLNPPSVSEKDALANSDKVKAVAEDELTAVADFAARQQFQTIQEGRGVLSDEEFAKQLDRIDRAGEPEEVKLLRDPSPAPTVNNPIGQVNRPAGFA